MSERTPLLPPSSHGTHHLQTPRFILYQLTSLLSTLDGIAGTLTWREWKDKAERVRSFGGTLELTAGAKGGAVMLTLVGGVGGIVCVSFGGCGAV